MTELVELVQAAGLELPLPLWAEYRGQTAEAEVEADGFIVFDGQRFRSPSSAGSAARSALGYSGARKKPATNGWTYWSFRDADGTARLLADLRRTAEPLGEKS